MKIAVDSGPLSSADSVRGIGVYVRELSKNLKDFKLIDVFNTDLSKFDIIHFTRFNPFRVSIPFKKPAGTKFVLTIYDLIPLIYPDHFPSGIKGNLRWHLNKYLIRKNVDAIITISETSKKDICRFIEINPDKVFVTYLAPREIIKKMEIGNRKLEIIKRFNLSERFVLYTGDINYNKNIPNLVKACEIAKIPLVIVGKQAGEIEKMDLNHPELIHLKKVNWANVIRLGFVEDIDLVKLYNLAQVYIQPSFYEGFGLPLVEAVASKTPVAIAKNQCHVEILGDNLTYFDPNNIHDMAAKLLNPNKITKLPREYSWEKTAEKTLAIYNKV